MKKLLLSTSASLVLLHVRNAVASAWVAQGFEVDSEKRSFRILFECTKAALLILSFLLIGQVNTSFGQTQTYYIPASGLVGLDYADCGGAGPYTCAASAQVGFNWTDVIPAGNNITAVNIQYRVGIECSAGSKTTFLNSVGQGNVTTTTPSNGCNCALAGNMPVISQNLAIANYNRGSNNTYRITTGASCMGFYPHFTGGTYAVVTVTYAPANPVPVVNNVSISTTPGGAAVSPITADNSTVYYITVQATSADGVNDYGSTYGIMALVFQNSQWTNARGYFAWHPTAYVHGAEQGACGSGGGFVSKEATTYGPSYVTLIPSMCSTWTSGNTRYVSFAFRANETYGDVQGMDIAGYAMDPTGATNNWYNFFTNFNVLPKPVDFSSTAFINNGINSGTGYVNLSWPSAGATATGYYVYIWDGNAYRPFDTGNVTSWTTNGKALFPTDAEINSWGDNTISTDVFHHSGGGQELRDNPERLYEKTIGTGYDDSRNYWFRIAPYNSAGAQSYTGAYTPTFDDRTPPTIAIGSHTNQGTYTVGYGQTITISGTSTDMYGLHAVGPAGAGLQKIAYDIDGPDDTGIIDFDNTPAAWSQVFGPFTPGSTNTIYFRAYDNNGNYNAWTSYIIVNTPFFSTTPVTGTTATTNNGVGIGTGTTQVTIPGSTSGCSVYGFTYTSALNGFGILGAGSFTGGTSTFPLNSTGDKWPAPVLSAGTNGNGSGRATFSMSHTITPGCLLTPFPAPVLTMDIVSPAGAYWVNDGNNIYLPLGFGTVVVNITVNSGGTPVASASHTLQGCVGYQTFTSLTMGWHELTTAPTAPTSVSGGTTVCSGTAVTLTASGGSNGAGATYQWYAGGCGSGTLLGTGVSISVTPSATTTYYVRRAGNGICPNVTACASATVTVNRPSVALTTTVNPVGICSGSSTISVNTSLAKGGLIDRSTWTVGTGSATGFGQNGSTSENSRINGTDPWGNSTVVWEATTDAASDADGGWDGSQVPIDNTKTYRYAVWVNRTVMGSDGRFYFGCQTNAGGVNALSGTPDGNPYFWYSSSPSGSELPVGEWVLVVGFVNPATYTGTVINPESGRYTAAGGLYGSTFSDFKWKPGTTTASLRTYLYYCTDVSTRQRWVYPRIDVVDGTEPSVQDLLNGFDVNGGLGTGATWQWNASSCGGSSAGTGVSVSVSPTVTTDYYVRAVGTCNTTPCVNATVTVNQKPTVPTITASGATTFCGGGSVTLTAASSLAGSALSFNGSGMNVDMGNPGALQITGNQTIEMWIKPNNFTGRQNPYNKAYGGEGTITQEPGGDLNYYWGTSGINGGTYQGFGSVGTLNVGQWNHIAIVRDLTNNALRWYINGVQTATAVPSYPAATAGSLPAIIGNGYAGGYNGTIDEVRVWDIARTTAQIQNSMNTTVAPGSAGLAGYWRMDEAAGTQVLDASGNSTTGIFASGSPAWVTSTAPLTPAFTWSPSTGLNTTTGNVVTATPTSTQTYTVSAASPHGCGNSTNTQVVTVHPNFSAGSINSTGETICYGGDPAAIGSSASASGGSGTITYKWTANGTDITSTNSATYNPPAGLTATTTYRRFAHDAVCNPSFAQSSNTWVVTVNPQLAAGTISAAQTICYNTAPAALTNVSAATGGTGSYTYQWQSSPNGSSSWSNVPSGGGSSGYSPGSLTTTTYYRRNVTSGTCGTVSSNTIIITVGANNTLGPASSSPTVCEGTAITNITHSVPPDATGITSITGLPTGVTAAWSSGLITISGTPTTSNTFNYSITLVGGCLNGATATGTITVVAQPTISLTGNNQSICSGSNAAAFSASLSGGSGCSIQWQSSIDGTTWSNLSTGVSYTPTGLTSSRFYRAVSTGCITGCSQAISETRFVAVTPTPTIQTHPLPASQTVCPGTDVNYSAQANIGLGTTRYRLVLTSAHGGTWHGIQEIRGYNSSGVEQLPLVCQGASSATYSDLVCSAASYGASNAFDGAYPGASSGVQWLTPKDGSVGNTNYQNASIYNPFYSPEWIEWSSPEPLSEIWIYNGRYASGPSTTSFKDFYITVSHDGGATWATVKSGTMSSNQGLDGNNNKFVIEPTYTWKKGTTTVGTGKDLALTSVAAADAGTYTVQMTYGCGTVTSNSAVLAVNASNTVSAGATTTRCISVALSPTVTHTTTGATGIGAATGLPPGLTASWASNTITISGTPTTANTYNYSIPLTGGCGTIAATGTITINPALPASVSISASANTICPGTSVTFTATPTNGGTTPTYQWKIGATNVGTNSNTYTTTSLTNGNVVTVVMTSNATCATGSPATSNTQTITVISPTAPVASVTAQPTCAAQGTITISSPIGAVYEYALNNGTYQSSASFPGLAPGSYSATVRLAASPTCISASGPSLTINNTPTALPAAPTVFVCQGSTGTLVSTNNCINNFVIPFNQNSIYYGWASTGPTAATPTGLNTATCSFGGAVRAYSVVQFQVSVTGNYVFEMNDNPAYNASGYIYTGNFTPGVCGSGTLVRADSDDGVGNEPKLGGPSGDGAMNLTAGITYYLVSATDVTAQDYTWTITPPGGGNIMLNEPGSVQWYTASSGGSPIYTGQNFNPVGVSGSGLSNTNTAGTWTYYAACSSSPSCRTAAAFTVTNTTTLFNITPAGATCYNPSVPVSVGLSGSLNGMTYRLMRDGVSTGIETVGTGGVIVLGNTGIAGNYTVVAVISGTCLIPMNGIVEIKPAPIANAGADVTLCTPNPPSLGLTGSSNTTTIATEDFGTGNDQELTNTTSAWRVHYLYNTHPANRTEWHIGNSSGNANGPAPYSIGCATAGAALATVDHRQFQTDVTCDYAWDAGIMDEIAYKITPIDARLYTSVNVSFNYMAGGNYTGGVVRDYMQVMYSLDNGVTWVAVSAGNNVGSYTLLRQLNTTTNAFFSTTPGTPAYGVANVSIPAVTGKYFLLGFRWTNDGDQSGDFVGNMMVDNIVVSGAASYSWSPTTGVTGPTTSTPTITLPGTYTVTVTAGNGCTTTDDVVVRPRADIIAMATSACSGSGFTVAPANGTNGTVPSGTTYTWAAPNVATVTGEASGTSATNITGTLVNTTNAPVNVVYSVTPTANGCTSNPFNVTVTVNPRPAITAMTATTCSPAAFSVTPVNVTNGIVPSGTTYSWSAPTVTGGLTGGAASSGSPTSIGGTLTNPSTTAQTATYSVTATSGSCTSTFSVTVTVSPSVTVPTAITFTGTEPSCQLTSGSSTDYNSTASVGVLSWSLTGITNSSGTILTSAINTSTGVVTWPNGWSGSVTVNVVSTGCGGPSTAVTRTVTVGQTVGTPTAISVSAGSEPPCQLTSGTTTTYSTTASNSTGFNWSISNPAAGSINATTGVMTWTVGFSGSVNIQVTASGCNGPSAQVTRTVTVGPTVGTPTAITVSAGTEPTCQLTNGTTTTTYSSSASNSSALNWSLSNPAAGSINSSGVMTWAYGFYGTVDIRVTASGCNGPSAQVTRTVNIGIGVLNAGFRTWTGLAYTQLWQNAGNWDCGGVPTSIDAVIIPEIPLAGQNETPRIENSITGHCLTIRVEGNITDRIEIQTGGILQVHQ